MTVASAKVVDRVYEGLFGGPAFTELAAQGAKPQRLLWASSGVKNPGYAADNVEPLVGPDTATSMPQRTLDSYREHSAPAATWQKLTTS